MKIQFKNKKFFDFLRFKLPHDSLVNNLKNKNVSFENCDELEIIFPCDVDLLKDKIKSLILNDLDKDPDYPNSWNQFVFRSENFNKKVRFCYTLGQNNPWYEKLYKPGRFLDNYTFDTDPPNDYKESSDNKEKEKSKMANNSGIWGMTKEDFKDGLWRNGANEMVKVVKVAILKACKLQGMNKIMYNAVQKTLDWSITTGAIHSALGYALTYVPMLSAHPQAQRMAKELRIEGMKYVQAEIIEQVKELVPDLLKILSTVSPEEESEQRIKIEEKVETKRISAPELIEHQASIEAMAEKEMVQAKRSATATN